MNRLITKLKDNRTGIVFTLFVIFTLFVLGIYAVKHFGTQYSEEKVQEQLKRSGLSSFVHYDSLHFNPFTLTPSLENVRFGSEVAPWLRFARISFNSYPVTYPNIDVNFWLQESDASNLSREAAQWIHSAGLKTLLGKGSIVSNVNGQDVSSHLNVHIKDLGKLSISSNITLLDSQVSMRELRTDFLASLALGQPEAILIIHGDTVEIHDADIYYQDTGMIKRLWPSLPTTKTEKSALSSELQLSSQDLGFAQAYSVESKHIADTILDFSQSPTSLHLALSPSSPVNLKELALMANDNILYKASNMALSRSKEPNAINTNTP